MYNIVSWRHDNDLLSDASDCGLVRVLFGHARAHTNSFCLSVFLFVFREQIVLWAGYGESRGRQTECTEAVQELFGSPSMNDLLSFASSDTEVLSFIVNPRYTGSRDHLCACMFLR